MALRPTFPFTLLVASVVLVVGCSDAGSARATANKNQSSNSSTRVTPPPETSPIQTLTDQERDSLMEEVRNDLENYYGNTATLESAYERLKQVLEGNPDYAPAYFQLARIVLKGGHIVDYRFEGGALEKAEAILNHARGLDEKYPDPYVLLSYIYALQGEFTLSDKAYADAKNRHATSPWLELNRAFALHQQGKLDSSEQIYKTYLSSSSNVTPEEQNAHVRALTELMTIEYNRGNRQAVKAYAELVVAAAREGDSWSWGNAASCLVGQGFFDEGIEFARNAIRTSSYSAVHRTLAEGLYGKWGATQSDDNLDMKSPLLAEAIALRPDIKEMAQDFSQREGSMYKTIGARLLEVAEKMPNEMP